MEDVCTSATRSLDCCTLIRAALSFDRLPDERNQIPILFTIVVSTLREIRRTQWR